MEHSTLTILDYQASTHRLLRVLLPVALYRHKHGQKYLEWVYCCWIDAEKCIGFQVLHQT